MSNSVYSIFSLLFLYNFCYCKGTDELRLSSAIADSCDDDDDAFFTAIVVFSEFSVAAIFAQQRSTTSKYCCIEFQLCLLFSKLMNHP